MIISNQIIQMREIQEIYSYIIYVITHRKISKYAINFEIEYDIGYYSTTSNEIN